MKTHFRHYDAIIILIFIALFILGVMSFPGCAGNKHAQDASDMGYKYAPEYIFNNPVLSEQEKEISWIGFALGQKIDELTGDDISAIWDVYYKGKVKVYDAFRKKDVFYYKGSPVESWRKIKGVK